MSCCIWGCYTHTLHRNRRSRSHYQLNNDLLGNGIVGGILLRCRYDSSGVGCLFHRIRVDGGLSLILACCWSDLETIVRGAGCLGLIKVGKGQLDGTRY